MPETKPYQNLSFLSPLLLYCIMLLSVMKSQSLPESQKFVFPCWPTTFDNVIMVMLSAEFLKLEEDSIPACSKWLLTISARTPCCNGTQTSLNVAAPN